MFIAFGKIKYLKIIYPDFYFSLSVFFKDSPLFIIVFFEQIQVKPLWEMKQLQTTAKRILEMQSAPTNNYHFWSYVNDP